LPREGAVFQFPFCKAHGFCKASVADGLTIGGLRANSLASLMRS
jgi:hypothetical protein